MRAGLLAALCLITVACADTATPSTTTVSEPVVDTPEAVFSELVAALQADDPERTAVLTDQAQIPLLAIAEGVAGGEVETLTEADRDVVAANFWRGFADQLEASLGIGLEELRIDDIERMEVAGTEFAAVNLVFGTDGSSRRVVLRRTDDRWVVDLIASFPSPLLGLIPNVAQVIRASGDPELLADMEGYEPSVAFLLAQPDLDPVLNQAGTAALEAIVR